MKSKIQGIVGGIALAVALACAGQARAANDNIFTSSAQIGNLTFRLVDLDPTDGVGPSATFNMSTILGDGVSEGYSQYDGSILPSTSLLQSNANQSAEASPTGLRVSSVLSSQDIASQIDPSVQGSQWINTGSPMPWIYATAPDQNVSPYASITLGANTAIAISGTASVQGSFNAAKLSELLSTMAPNGGTFEAYLSGNFNPYVHLALSTNEGNADYSSVAWNNSSASEFNLMGQWPAYFLAAYNNVPTDLPEQTFEDQHDFIIQYANFGTTDKSVNLEMDLQSSNTIAGNLTLSSGLPETPTIPEPSTYALMALGLVGIGLVRRKAAR